MPDRATITPHVVRAVRELLERAPAYRKLPDDERRKLVDGLVDLGGTLALDDAPAGDGLPGFVASLVEGTFQAVVNASIEQMHAYADLVHSISADGEDVPRIRERLGGFGKRPAAMAGRIKWPP